MRNKKLSRKLIPLMIVFVLIMGLMTGCGSKNNIEASPVYGVDDLANKTIGVQLGTTGDIYASDIEGADVQKFNKGADAVQALKQGKVDAVIIDEQPAKAFVSRNEGKLAILDEAFVTEEYAICFAKENIALQDQVNKALAELKEEGTLDQIIGNYIGDDTKGKQPYESPEDIKYDGKLIMATNAEFEPYEFLHEGEIVGIDAEMARAIADKLGKELEIQNIQFDSIITAVQSGKADMGIAGMTVTEDRLKNINFSDPYTTAKQVIVVRPGEVGASPVKTADDLNGKKIGVQLGTTGDIYASDIEDAKVEKYNKGADAVQALKQGKVDAVIIDGQPAKAFVDRNRDLSILDDPFVTEEYAICIAKGNLDLLDDVNKALAELKEEGVLDQIVGNYIGDDTKGKQPYESPEDIKYDGKLIMATNAEFEPYEYLSKGEIVGIDAEMAKAIADKLGKELEIQNIQFDSIITAVQSGKADMGVAGMTVTEDRLKNINFTDPYTTASQVIIVRNGKSATAFDLKESIYNNFQKDSRWKYITNGLFVTIQITSCAVILGIVLGFLIAIARSSCDMTGKAKLLNWILKAYLTLIRGTPAMIQLLIIYYVIFASSNINKILVAVLAFGLNSSAYIAEIVRAGIMSIDSGQFEAGRSLGFTYAQTMRHFIMPQAFKNVLPALGNEFIVLLKETSIAGYIGIMDLTRGGDTIRSLTYEAFFPLMTVALIYLVMVMGLTALVGKMERSLKNDER
ncbi:MAG: ABC transporter permease subunit [Lachnospiraceae bacterium]|nr:ABC transporter permease subunit [Lachnospiraceae bacterium]